MEIAMSELGKRTTTPSRSVNGNGEAATTTRIEGRAFNRLLRRSTPSQKAIIAADLHAGRLEIVAPTWSQVLALAGGSYGYAYTAGKRTDAERAAVHCGRSLSGFHSTPDVFTALARAMNAVLRESDEAVDVGTLVDRLVERYPDRVMAAFDRYTAPELPLAA
jgi:hypothetical protein